MNGKSGSKFNLSRIKSNLNVYRFHFVRLILGVKGLAQVFYIYRITKKYERL